MDILAGMLAYVAGIGALIAGLAISFSVFFATANPSQQTENQPQSASAMLVRPSTANKPAVIGAVARQSAGHSDKPAEKRASAAGLPSAAQPTASREIHRKHAPSAAQARRLNQEERARRWAYQQSPNLENPSFQNPSFESRFLGYAD